MIIIYGDVELHFETARVCSWRAVYSPDGSTFLFWHFRIGAVAEVARYATGGIGPQGVAIEVLSRIMMTPGQRLTVADDEGQIMVDSPEGLGAGATTVSNGQRNGYRDVNQGPKPIHFEVLEMRPSETTRVYFECETWTARCPGIHRGNPGQVPILSHLWEERHFVDRLLFTTRVIQGEVRFRSDVLRRISRSPDEYRQLIFPRIPANCRREEITVWTDKAGLTCYYQTKDVEQSRMLRTRLLQEGVEKVDAEYSSGWAMIGSPTPFPAKTTQLVIECYGNRNCRPEGVATTIDNFFRSAGFFRNPFGLVPQPGFVLLDQRNMFTIRYPERYVRAELNFHSNLPFFGGQATSTSPLKDVRDVTAAITGDKGFYINDAPGQGSIFDGLTYTGRILHQVLKDHCDAPKSHPERPERFRRRNVQAVDPAHNMRHEPVVT